jgi:hypothetical protein
LNARHARNGEKLREKYSSPDVFFLPVFKHIESHDVESHDKPIEIRQVEDVVHSGRRVGGMGK